MSVKISSLNTASTINSGDDINIAGNNPLAFSDWGGGWFMEDTVWIRSYNNKSLWMNVGNIGADGCLTIGYGGTAAAAGSAIIAGNLGVGTSTPDSLSANTSSLSVNSTRTDLSGGIFLKANNTAKTAFYWGSEGLLTEVVSGSALWYLGGSEKMRITSGGALLIGTTSTTNTAAGKIVNRLGGTSNPDLVLNGGAWSIASIGGEPALYLSSNIVAATGLPSATQTAKGGMGFEYSSATSPTDLVLGIFGSPTVASSVKFFNNTERMRITSGGNILMNTTTSPTVGGFSNTTLSIKQLADGLFGGGLHIEENGTTSLAYFGFDGNTFRIGTSYRTTGDYRPISFATSGTERLRIANNGNILIGTTTDEGYKLYVNGTGLFNGVVNSYATMDNLGRRINSPEGASYITSTSSVTGAIKIKLPVARNNSATMMMFRVKIYQYSTGNSYELQIGGYNYNLGGWYNPFVTNLTDDGSNFSVRFGTDATSDCVWIGETSSTWGYPQVFVTDFQAGYNATGIEWATGWGISFETAFDTVELSRLASQVITTRNIASQSVSYATTAGALTSMLISQFTNDSGYVTSGALAAYLPLAGGTLTGNLNGTTYSFSGANPTYQKLALSYPSTFVSKLNIGLGSYIQNDDGNEILTLSANATDGKIVFKTGSSDTERMRITSAGNVGIGTASPSSILETIGQVTINAASSGAGIGKLQLKGAKSDGNGFNLSFDNSTNIASINLYYNGALTFGNANTERMRIAPTSGNLLLNTTTDSGYKLDVNGTARVSGAATFSSSVTTGAPSTSTAGLIVKGGSSIGTPALASGQILVGATSTYRLSMAYDDNTGYAYIDNLYDNVNSNIYFRTRTSGTPINALTLTGTGAATFSSSVTASSLIKSGGTSAQFLKADGSVDSNTYVTSAALAGYLPLTGGTLTGDLTVNTKVYVGTHGCYFEEVLIGSTYELRVVDSAGNMTIIS